MLGSLLEAPDHPAAPEGVGPGDEDAAAHAQPNQTLRAVAQHVVDGLLELGADRARPPP